MKVGCETADAGPHRVERHRLLRATAAAVFGGAVCEESSQQLRRQVLDIRAGANALDPFDQRGHVPAILPDRVRGSAIGAELEKEALEGILELHIKRHLAIGRGRAQGLLTVK